MTVIGCFVNSNLFNPTKDKYYAMILMRMDAREYTLVNYLYAILKVVIGFLPFGLLFGMDRGLPLWFCLLLPLCIVGMKLFVAATSLWDYEKRGFGYNENKLSKYVWGGVALFLLIAYALPALGVVVPASVSMAVFLACIPLGAVGLAKVLTFRDYRGINKELLSGLTNQMDSQVAVQIVKQANEKKISADTSISSNHKVRIPQRVVHQKKAQKDPLGFHEKDFLRMRVPRRRGAGGNLSAAGRKIRHQRNRDDVAAILRVYSVCHQPWHEFYPGAFYEVRPQPADLL